MQNLKVLQIRQRTPHFHSFTVMHKKSMEQPKFTLCTDFQSRYIKFRNDIAMRRRKKKQ